MEPPIHTEYLRSGGAMTRILLPAGASEMISFCRRSASPTRKMITNNRLYLTCSIQYGYGEILNFSCTLHYRFSMYWVLSIFAKSCIFPDAHSLGKEEMKDGSMFRKISYLDT